MVGEVLSYSLEDVHPPLESANNSMQNTAWRSLSGSIPAINSVSLLGLLHLA